MGGQIGGFKEGDFFLKDVGSLGEARDWAQCPLHRVPQGPVHGTSREEGRLEPGVPDGVSLLKTAGEQRERQPGPPPSQMSCLHGTSQGPARSTEASAGFPDALHGFPFLPPLPGLRDSNKK